MIKKLFLTLALSSLAGGVVMAQKHCGTDEARARMLKIHPEIVEKEEQLRKEILEKLTHADLSPYARVTADGDSSYKVEYDVPIVFHVIHDYGSEYINDSLIYKCVREINDMYNKRNSDTSEVVTPFKGFINNSSTRYIGNAKITWHLATKDPDGKPTNGITRRQSYLTKIGSDQAKYDLWPPSNYMNVWLINTMSAAHDEAAAYAYKPGTADMIPYYDGILSLASAINNENTISHELGHTLNLDHPWGGTNSPEVACGDDEVDDTPPTRGHLFGGCIATRLFDSACLFSTVNIAKIRLDSIKRADASVAIKVDTSTSNGITFVNRTTSELKSIDFYPHDTIGSTYVIALARNGVITNTKTVVTTVKDSLQKVTLDFKIPGADTSVKFKLYFSQNPGVWKDTVVALTSIYSKGVNGSIFITNTNSGEYYNGLYNWQIRHGFFMIYSKDSLVDYPDTTNAQNVMDYTYCSKMFTHGQTLRMRAALTSTVANRANLISEANLIATGALDPKPSLAPKAEFSINAATSSASTEPTYFLCQDAVNLFSFTNRTWRADADVVSWTLTNGASTATSTSKTNVTSKFSDPGWATISMVASNASGADTFKRNVYVANSTAINPIGYYQDFNLTGDLDQWPIFNYYNNQFKWEYVTGAGYYDNTSFRYRSFDDRLFPNNLVGEQNGDRDDFFTRAFDLSGLGSNGNLNFMYAGAYTTSDPTYMQDSLEISYSTNCGATWTVLRRMKGAQLQTVGSVTKEFAPGYTDWKPMSVDLKTAAGANIRDSRVFFRFRFRPFGRTLGSAVIGTGNNFYIDRINISNNPLAVNEMILGDRKAAIAPNPTNGSTFVLLTAVNTNINVRVTDVTGKIIYDVNQHVDENNARIEIPASAIAVKGMYLVHITGQNIKQTEKLVVY